MPTYRVDLHAAPSRRVRVEMSFVAAEPETRLELPVWTPGSYLVREFPRYLGPVEAIDADGRPLAVQTDGKSAWRVRSTPGEAVVVRWDAYCNELTVRTPHADPSHAFFTGSNLLLFRSEHRDEPSRVTFDAPADWTVYCALDRDADGAWLAPDVDTLLDTPFEAGPAHQVVPFEAGGRPHRFIFWGYVPATFDEDALVRDTAAIIETHRDLFGGELPYDRYDFVVHVTSQGRGGLEHLNSTVLATPWAWYTTDDGYHDLLGLISHEHFHTWNVKRIRPSGLFPFRYDRENHTRALWVSEGFTSYYDDLQAMRAGALPEDAWLSRLAKAWSRYENTPGRFRQSVADASHDAWFRLYRPDDDSPFRTVSYYLKGSLIALALDLTLRQRSEGRASLDDVMRDLWAEWRTTGGPFDELGMAERIEGCTGVSVDDVLASWVDGTDDPPLDALLATIGITTSRTSDDASWGGLVFDVEGRVRIRHVAPQSAGDACGLQPGDELVAVDGRRVVAPTWEATWPSLRNARPLRITVFRRDELVDCTLVGDAPIATRIELAWDAAPDVVVGAARRAWRARPGAPAST